jgi:hypothetical protein
MNMLKWIGWVAMGGLVLAGSIGGALWWQHRQRQNATPSPTPSNPPRKTEPGESEAAADRQPKNQAQHHTLRRDELSPELVADFDALFKDGWPPTQEVIDKLQPGEVIAFVAESEPTEDFDLPQREIITASVLSVGKTEVRARVIAPIAHADHHGNSAGHGLYVGALVEVPRSHIMVAARRAPDPDLPVRGYGSQGDPARVFAPSNGKTVYKVHPSTVYDLNLPYRTEDLSWIPSRENVKYFPIGDDGLRHQIMFTEASVRGEYSITVLDDDEREGNVFVGRWDFVIAE